MGEIGEKVAKNVSIDFYCKTFDFRLHSLLYMEFVGLCLHQSVQVLLKCHVIFEWFLITRFFRGVNKAKIFTLYQLLTNSHFMTQISSITALNIQCFCPGFIKTDKLATKLHKLTLRITKGRFWPKVVDPSAP